MLNGGAAAARKKPTAAPVKRLIIKGFDKKGAPQLPENFEKETWDKLHAAVTAVQQQRTVGYSLEELYKACEDLCFHRMAPNLHKRLHSACEEHVLATLSALLVRDLPEPADFLAALARVWNDHCQSMHFIASIFLYMDRTYVKQQTSVRSLWDMGLQLFRTHLIGHADVERRTVDALLVLVERERNGETIDRGLAKAVLRMFISLQIYHEVFEKKFLAASRIYYESEADALTAERDLPDYLLHVEQRLKEEVDRVSHYLDATTRRPLIAVLEGALLSPRHTATLIEKGLESLLADLRLADLQRMFVLYSRVGALDPLRLAFNVYIKKVGVAIVGEKERENTMVEDFLKFKSNIDAVLTEAFSKHEAFMHSAKEALEFSINSRPNLPAELLAKFIAARLLKGNKQENEEELESLLDKVMSIFRLLSGKDVFEAFYKADLSKRLLLGKSASPDSERTMIARLRAECGAQYVSKLEGMLKDMDLSAELMSNFRRSDFSSRVNTPDLQCYILTTGYWPVTPPLVCLLPPALSDDLDVFCAFYATKHSGRRLQWQHRLGHCVVRASFKSTKELLASLPQTIVLLLFNSAETQSFRELLTATGMERDELTLILQSLAVKKMRVLLSTAADEATAFGDEVEFRMNQDFTSKFFRIQMNAVQAKETPEEQKRTTEGVMQDRQYQIDAAIVRIMKTRRHLTHAQLISELYSQLKFPVKPPDLKKRIESLIDREYLERDEDAYNYLA